MSSVEYVVRDASGSARPGSFPEGDPSTIYVSFTKDVSLNLGTSDVASYQKHGNDLLVTLDNGQVLILSGYYDEASTGEKNLFLSQDGNIVEVVLEDGQDGNLFASYNGLESGGKWSEYDDLVFLDLGRVEPVLAPLAAPLLGGFGGLAAGGAAIAAVATSGGGGGNPITPTVDNPNATYEIGGTGDSDATVTGTGMPGSTVNVTIGTQTQTVTVDADGKWVAQFDPADLPGDGVYQVAVSVDDPDGKHFDLTGPTIDIDTTPPDLAVQSGTQTTGDIVNGAEHVSGTVITGTGEAGASVDVTINGTTHTTTVAADGTWSVTFATAEINAGEYDTGITIVTTDARGNAATFTDTLVVDTVAPPATLDTVEGDNIVNLAEASDGVVLSGTGEAGATISVVFQGVTQSTTVGANGQWSVNYASSDITHGTYDTSVDITSTDAAGNSYLSSSQVHIDTDQGLTLNAQVGGDYIINAAEQAAGVTLTGTSEPGASVVVTMGAVSHTVTTQSDGTWSVDFATNEIPTGTYDTTVTAVSTDAAGNVETTTSNVRVDTEIAVALDPTQAGDNIINAAEVAAGVNLTGTAEPGATVQVTMQGVTKTVTAAANGGWSATFSSTEIPAGEYDAPVSVTSSDLAGNTSTATGTVRVDTQTNVGINPNQAGGDDIVNAAEAAAGVTFTGTAEANSTVVVTVAGVSRTVSTGPTGAWSAVYGANTIPQGEYDTTISVTSTDAAGNTATDSRSMKVDTTPGTVAL